MTYRYRLGEHVKILGTCIKEWRNEPLEKPTPIPRPSMGGFSDYYLPEFSMTDSESFTDYVEAPRPMNSDYYRPDGDYVYYEDGVIVGRRTVSPGKTVVDAGGFKQYKRTPGASKRVWIVSYDLRRKPVMCFDHQVVPKGAKFHIMAEFEKDKARLNHIYGYMEDVKREQPEFADIAAEVQKMIHERWM